MTSKRILFLGITGVQKEKCIRRILDKYERDHRYIDFDSEYLFNSDKGGMLKTSFLNMPVALQFKAWRESWDLFLKENSKQEPFDQLKDDIFLSLHGSIIRGHYGVRSVVDINRVIAFKPTFVFNLITDVYDMWWRTEQRAEGLDGPLIGQPSLEQLICGRRFELIIGDQIALSCNPKAKHLLMPIAHPIETIIRSMSSKNIPIVYLSFPISEPRRMQENGDNSGISAINDFINKAYQVQSKESDIAFICPLAIDELPLIKMPQLDDAGLTEVTFNRSLRWNLSSIWPEEKCIGDPTVITKPFPKNQILDARGNINSDVSWRDYRLVEQSKCLAVFNPIFNNKDRPARSVQNEINSVYSMEGGRVAYIYQDPAHDNNNNYDKYYCKTTGGTMFPYPTENLHFRCSSIEKLFSDILDHCRKGG